MAQDDAKERFYALVGPQMAVVLRTASVLTRNAAEAEDLAQETLLKAFKAIDTFRPGTDVKAWLMAILRHARVDRLRAAASSASDLSLDAQECEPAERPHAESLDPQAVCEDPEQVLNAFSDQQVIDALHGLPEEIRWTLLLVDVQGLDQHEAAAILDVPVGTIKSRAHRGRAMLRKALFPLARDLRLVRERHAQPE